MPVGLHSGVPYSMESHGTSSPVGHGTLWYGLTGIAWNTLEAHSIVVLHSQAAQAGVCHAMPASLQSGVPYTMGSCPTGYLMGHGTLWYGLTDMAWNTMEAHSIVFLHRWAAQTGACRSIPVSLHGGVPRTMRSCATGYPIGHGTLWYGLADMAWDTLEVHSIVFLHSGVAQTRVCRVIPASLRHFSQPPFRTY